LARTSFRGGGKGPAGRKIPMSRGGTTGRERKSRERIKNKMHWAAGKKKEGDDLDSGKFGKKVIHGFDKDINRRWRVGYSGKPMVRKRKPEEEIKKKKKTCRNPGRGP